MPTVASINISTLYSFFPGTYDGFATVWAGTPASGPVGAPYYSVNSHDAKPNPVVVNGGAVTGAAAQAIYDNLLSGAWVLNCLVFGSLGGTSVPYDEFNIYDTWACVTYDDSSIVVMRPSTFTVNDFGPSNGTLVNPGNMCDNDPSTFGSIRQIAFFFGGGAAARVKLSGWTIGPPPSTNFLTNHAYALNDLVVDLKAHVQRCIVAGTSGPSYPTWNDTGGNTVTGGATFQDQGTIACGLIPGPSITCDSPPAGTIGVPYSHNFPASSGLTPYTYAIVTGSLPPGLSLNTSTGDVTGTPTTAGTYPFRIQVTDFGAQTAHADCSITINPTPLIISCDSPPAGLTGIAYAHAFPASGGAAPYTFGIIVGSLPPGLTLDPSSGIAAGTPTTAGTYPFTIQVTDSLFTSSSIPCSITIGQSVGITCGSPPPGLVGTPYTHTFPASGGTSPYTFAITVGSLPPGLTLNTSTGAVSGTPTTDGTYPFTIQVTDHLGAIASVPCSIVIGGSLAITCGSPPIGTVGLAYSHVFPATGGTPPYTFSITAGGLPPGLSLNTGTGAVTGTPTDAGTFGFTIQVQDSVSATASVPCSISIVSVLTIDCDNPPAGLVGTPYSHTFPAGGGTAPYSFAITLGFLPPGLSLNASTGVVSGVPLIAGGYGFTIQVTDSLGAKSSVNCGISIAGITPPLHANCNNPPAGMVDEPYAHTFTATDGTPPYSFAISAGVLPPGLEMTSGGVVTGEPTEEGTYPFTVQVTDGDGTVSTVNCSIAIMGICPCSRFPIRNAGPPAGLSTPKPIVSSPRSAPPMTFSSQTGTIFGAIDGLNGVYTVGMPLSRARVWRNGLAMTLNVDVVAGANVVKFLDKGTPSEQIPHPSYPQPGDVLLIEGWPLA